MDPLDKVYNINERIKKLQGQIEKLQVQNSRKGQAADNAVAHRIEDLNAQIAALTHERNREMKKVRWSAKRPPRKPPAPKEERVPSPVSIASSPEPEPVPLPRVPTPVPVALDRVLIPCKLKVSGMKIGTNSTSLTMAPTWFKPDDTQSAMQGVVSPDKPINRQQLTTLARFRTSVGKSKDFRAHPVDLSERSTEVLVLSLDAFAQQYGGQLSFTNRDLSFDSSAENAACGVPNLGSAHLLANDTIPTAQFCFCLALDYDRQLAISPDRMQNFVVNFSAAVAQVLGCKSDYVRVFSVDKSSTDPGMVEVNFGLTTPILEDTKSLAIKLQVSSSVADDQTTGIVFRIWQRMVLEKMKFFDYVNCGNTNVDGVLFYRISRSNQVTSILDSILITPNQISLQNNNEQIHPTICLLDGFDMDLMSVRNTPVIPRGLAITIVPANGPWLFTVLILLQRIVSWNKVSPLVLLSVIAC